MQTSNSNDSFIPKQKAVKKRREAVTRKVFVFSLFAYISLFGALASSGGTFLYKTYVESRQTRSILDLNQSIDGFDVDSLNKVKNFDNRLRQIKSRLNGSVSYLSILKAIEESTVGTVQYKSLKLEREGDVQYIVSAEILTNSFDSTIFQQKVYLDNPNLQEVSVSDVKTDNGSEDSDKQDYESEIKGVSFVAELLLPLSTIGFDGQSSLPVTTPTRPNASSQSWSTDVNSTSDYAPVNEENFISDNI
jgi:hypothetical protein